MEKNSSFIEKDIFLESSETLLICFVELATRKLVDADLRIGVSALQALPNAAKSVLRIHNANAISEMTSEKFKILTSHLDESYITLSYSWLETYLSVVEEVLYLHDPRSLGDNIQIKLGKILGTESVVELIHDAVKKRLKEKSSWGLRNRVSDLKETYDIKITHSDTEIDFISKTRNDLVHDKKIGDFAVSEGKIKYKYRNHSRRKINANFYLDAVLNLTIDLFCETSKRLNIDRRNKKYKHLEQVCDSFRKAFKDDSRPSEIQ